LNSTSPVGWATSPSRRRETSRISSIASYPPEATTNRITLHTVLVYFNGGFEGGETRFREQVEQTLVPKPGLAAVFQHKLRHEGRPLRAGTKYAMRTDVIYEAPEPVVTPG
jgi:hypothetical protein